MDAEKLVDAYNKILAARDLLHEALTEEENEDLQQVAVTLTTLAKKVGKKASQ